MVKYQDMKKYIKIIKYICILICNKPTNIINYYYKYKNKLIILDNVSSYRNEIIKNLINQNNKTLYSVPY